MKLVIIESPFACDPEEMIKYGRKAIRDSILRDEAPIASHLLYPQPGVLDDTNPVERAQGIGAGYAWMKVAELCAVYSDFGISEGMKLGIQRARAAGIEIERREIGQDGLDEFADVAMTSDEWEDFQQEVREEVATNVRLAALRYAWMGWDAAFALIADKIDRGDL